MKSKFQVSVLILVLMACLDVSAQVRMQPIPEDKMTPAQKKAVAEYKLDRPGGLFGHWETMLRIPEILIPYLRVQEHMHATSRLGEKLTHFCTLIAARQWTSQVIWASHDRDALKSGVEPEVMKALAEGRRPEQMTEEEEILYDFSLELQRNQGSVSDHTYDRALSKFGEEGVIEATLIQGEYTLIAMFFNMNRDAIPQGGRRHSRRFLTKECLPT